MALKTIQAYRRAADRAWATPDTIGIPWASWLGSCSEKGAMSSPAPFCSSLYEDLAGQPPPLRVLPAPNIQTLLERHLDKLRAFHLHLKIGDIPIRYRDRTYGETNIQRWRHGVLLLKMLSLAITKIKLI